MARTTEKKKKAEDSAAMRPDGHCSLPKIMLRPLSSNVLPQRERLIRISDKKWVNHTVLHYYFLDTPSLWRGSEDDKEAVRQAFESWKALPIGIDFAEVHDAHEAEIRIGFYRGDGSWSYVGRDAIDFVSDPAERTMNFGWSLTTPYGRDTALHEIGHALGFPHEHQNPNSGIEWDEPAVYSHFAGPPNYWDRDTTYWNILRKLSPAEVDGSDWDRNSIMHYQFEAGLITSPEVFQDEPLIPAPGLSQVDMETAKRFYPALATPQLPELRPYEAHRIRVEPGQQLDFEIRPSSSRTYVMQTLGRMDTVMVLFEEIDGEPAYTKGDDDSGSDLNSRIEQRLFKGRRYFLRLRLYFTEASGEGAVIMH